jgi:hypothetical protein
MKKYFIGILIGAILTISTTAFADDIKNLIGKKVDGQQTVTLDGKSIGKAVIIQGKSYVPVREITNGFGGNIELKKGGTIALTSPTDITGSITLESNSKDDLNAKIKDQEYYIERTKSEITGLEKQASEYKVKVDRNKELGATSDAETIYATLVNLLEKAKQKLEQQELELAALNK